MNLKPSEPDEHGVRRCGLRNCELYFAPNDWHTECLMRRDEFHDSGAVCEPWVRELVKAGYAIRWGATLEDLQRWDALHEDEEIEVEP